VGLVNRAQAGAGVLVVTDALGEDVAGAGQRLLGRRRFLRLVLAVVGGVFPADIDLGRGDGVGGGVLRPEQVGERFEALLLREGGAGALLRPERR
jgi:hypothetical protein